MKIEYRVGNILTTDCKYICHCVNMQGRYNSGVAKEIRYEYPKAYELYYEAYLERAIHLGQIIGADCGKHIILNLVGQRYYGREPGRVYADYIALRKGFQSINKNISEAVAFPLIGCGTAGGDWKIVSSILEEESTNFQPVVYQFDDEIKY